MSDKDQESPYGLPYLKWEYGYPSEPDVLTEEEKIKQAELIKKEADRRKWTYYRCYETFAQLVEYCTLKEDIEIGIFVKDKSNILDIAGLIGKCFDDYTKKIQDSIRKVQMTGECDFRFLVTGNRISVLSSAASIRGRKFNVIVVDSSIDEDIKNEVIRPALISQYDYDGNPIIHPIRYVELDMRSIKE